MDVNKPAPLDGMPIIKQDMRLRQKRHEAVSNAEFRS